MHIRQFRYGSDNLGYLLWEGNQALAIDGGAPEILAFAESAGLVLAFVSNTHGHADHTSGNKRLVGDSGARYLDHRDLSARGSLELGGTVIRVYPAPGHTEDSVVFHAGSFLVTGDALFNGTVGNCFSGDLDAFLRTIRFLMTLPDHTVVYAGHDYVKASMAFARIVEPDNPEIDRFLSGYDPKHVRSTLAEERRVNPYFRFNEESVVSFLKKTGSPVGTETERWKSLMGVE
jgi:hydroxyacylglutathione hydrolase